MVAAISAINPNIHGIDYEYMRILAELRSLGIPPTGNKSSDANKLAEAKNELITKIKNKNNEIQERDFNVQKILPVEELEDAKRSEMEEQRLGAMNIAELNKIYFKIL